MLNFQLTEKNTEKWLFGMTKLCATCYSLCFHSLKKALTKFLCKCFTFNLWTQLGLNQRPPDYESGATNQLSYRSVLLKK